MTIAEARVDLMSAPIDDEAVAALAAGFRGQLLRPEDDGYDVARQVWNAMIDRRPALVARCAGVADVLSALAFARDNGLPLAVRGGGHNVAGNAVCDGGVVIDLTLMKGIRVDLAARTVRAEGVTWGELDHETQAFGLATTGGAVSTTGIAGLTLGGGYRLAGTFLWAGRATTSLPPTWSPPTAGSCRRARTKTPISSGVCVGAAGTSASSRRSSISSIRSGRWYSPGRSSIPLEAARDVFRAYRDFAPGRRMRSGAWPGS